MIVMAIAMKVKSFAAKGFDKTKAATTAVSAAMMVAAAQVMPVFCDLNPDNFTDEKVLNAVLSIFFKIALIAGILLIFAAVIMIAISFLSDAPERKLSAMMMAVVGIVLVILRACSNPILALFGLTGTTG